MRRTKIICTLEIWNYANGMVIGSCMMGDYHVQFWEGLEGRFLLPTHLVIISKEKNRLINSISLIKEKLKETHQEINKKKTKLETAYHGVPFLGKVSYPYGYQKPNKQVIIRICQKAKEVKNNYGENLLANINSQIRSLKNYNSKKLIYNYINILPKDIKNILYFDNNEYKLKKQI